MAPDTYRVPKRRPRCRFPPDPRCTPARPQDCRFRRRTRWASPSRPDKNTPPDKYCNLTHLLRCTFLRRIDKGSWTRPDRNHRPDTSSRRMHPHHCRCPVDRRCRQKIRKYCSCPRDTVFPRLNHKPPRKTRDPPLYTAYFRCCYRSRPGRRSPCNRRQAPCSAPTPNRPAATCRGRKCHGMGPAGVRRRPVRR